LMFLQYDKPNWTHTHTIQQKKLYFSVLKLWSSKVRYVASNVLLRTISSSRLIQFTFWHPTSSILSFSVFPKCFVSPSFRIVAKFVNTD
jgi:hypothetical protein